jgi:hypothetical protein
LAFLLAFRAEERVVDRPLIEDSFYSLAVARQIALGNGITIDGSTWTNGFQPLFTFLTVPAFLVTGGHRYLAIRYVLALHWLFYVGAAFLLARIARDSLPTETPEQKTVTFWLTFLLYMSAFQVFLQHFNGLETGFVLFLTCLTWRFYQVTDVERWSALALLGMLLGLVVLARIDTVFLVIAVSLREILPNRGPRLGMRFLRFATVGGLAFLVSSPWWFYNLAVFGHLMPTSGKAQELWALSGWRFLRALSALFQVFVPWVCLGSSAEGLAADVFRGVLVVAGLVILWRMRSVGWPRPFGAEDSDGPRKRTLEFGICLLAANAALVMWYGLSSMAPHFYPRYFSALVLISVLGASFIAARLAAIKPRLAAALVLLIAAPVLLTLALPGKVFRGNPWYHQQLALVWQHVPPADYVAADQAGTLGYFREKVVNLDGKVNPEALRFRGDIRAYLRQRDIRWYCDGPDSVTADFGPNPEAQGWRLVARADLFSLYHCQHPPNSGR